MKNVFLVEDHDEALGVWRRNKISGLDLVHIDAHMDFGFYQAHPPEDIVNEAASLEELKRRLEQSIAFSRYESDFEKQLNIGNYIYPAIREGIVNNFYWVIPGDKNEFVKSAALVKSIFKRIAGGRHWNIRNSSAGMISFDFLGRGFFVCCLEKLPLFKRRVLLDIDTDFLVISEVKSASNTERIGKRKPWILPRDLAEKLKANVRMPEIVTIAYSVNGGYTPIIYRHFGDEIAYCFGGAEPISRIKRNIKAAEYFNLFSVCGKKAYYRKAVALNRMYRAPDNNYGPLYLALGKSFLAEKEFLRILMADKNNPACFWGLGNIALGKGDFKKSKKYFRLAFILAGRDRLFYKIRNKCVLGLAEANLGLNNFREAREQLFHCKAMEPMQARVYYLLGCIFEREKDYNRAASFYRDANRLGFNSMDILSRLLEISLRAKKMYGIIGYVNTSYAIFKKHFLRMENLGIRGEIGINRLRRLKAKMLVFENKLRNAIKKGEQDARDSCFA